MVPKIWDQQFSLSALYEGSRNPPVGIQFRQRSAGALDVPLPPLRFPHASDDCVTLLKELLHIPHQEELVGDVAQKAEGRIEIKSILDQAAFWNLPEVVIVVKTGEWPCNHGITKVTGPLEARDATRKALANPEVPRTPNHFLSKAEQATRHATDGPLLRPRGGFDVKINGSTEVENTSGRCSDKEILLNYRHCYLIC